MTATQMDLPALTSTAPRCTGCGSSHTAWVHTAVADNVLCKTCGTCWHPASGRVERVNPQHCPGCSLRRICAAASGSR